MSTAITSVANANRAGQQWLRQHQKRHGEHLNSRRDGPARSGSGRQRARGCTCPCTCGAKGSRGSTAPKQTPEKLNAARSATQARAHKDASRAGKHGSKAAGQAPTPRAGRRRIVVEGDNALSQVVQGGRNHHGHNRLRPVAATQAPRRPRTQVPGRIQRTPASRQRRSSRQHYTGVKGVLEDYRRATKA